MKNREQLVLVIAMSWGALFPALLLPYWGILPALLIAGLAYLIARSLPVDGLSAGRVKLQFLLLLPPAIAVSVLVSLAHASLLTDLLTDVMGIITVACGVPWLYAGAYLAERLYRRKA